MEKKVDKKFTWVIKNFSSLQPENIYSKIFVVGGCKWHLSAYPKGYEVDNFLSLFLEVADYGSMPSGSRRNARYCLTVVNQLSEKLSRKNETQYWFDEKSNSWGFPSMLCLNEIHAKESGFLVNGELNIVVEIELIEIIGKVEVNGFHLLPSQVEFVSRMFEKHPEIASELHPENRNIRTGYMNLLLSLIDSLRQSPQELLMADLDEAYVALESLTNVGFNLNWLENKLDQLSEMKERGKAREIRTQVIKQELKELKHKCSELEAQLEKETSEALAAEAFEVLDS